MGNRFIIDLLIIKHNQSSGYQEYIFNLLSYFYNHREDIRYNKIVLWCKNTEIEAFSNYSDKFEIESFKYSSYFKRFYLQTFLPISEKLKRDDLLFSPGNTSGLVKRCNEILTIHDLLFKRKEWLPRRVMRWQRKLMIPISIKKADKIIAISNFTKDDIVFYYPNAKDKIEVIYNSINFEKFDHKPIDHPKEKYFLAICSNAYHKNFVTVLKAFNIYCHKGGNMNLIFVGRIGNSGPAYDEYNSLPENVKRRITARSNISNAELGELYENAACYISASLFEGLGMPVVEAMSFGLPVILSNIPPHREVSQSKGVYFEPTNAIQLAAMMEGVYNKRKDYSNTIKNVFSEKNTSANYISIINSFA